MEKEYDTLLKLNYELQELISLIVDKPVTAKDDKSRFITFALGKGFKTHSAVLSLAKVGYGQDAAILVRSLFELTIITYYILGDVTNGRMERYLDYDWILRK